MQLALPGRLVRSGAVPRGLGGTQLAPPKRFVRSGALPRAVGRPQLTQRYIAAFASSLDAARGARRKLQEAAEELIQEAAQQSEASAAALPGDALSELKRIVAFNQATAARLEGLEDKVAGLEVLLKDAAAASREVKAAVEAAAKQANTSAVTQTLQWAITNASVGEFKYNDHLYSGAFVQEVLAAFMKGKGRWIPDENGVGAGDESTRGQAFRDALSQQIHALTGVKPRIILKKNEQQVEQYVIFRA